MLGCVMCLISVMLCNISLCRYFKDSVGVWYIHCLPHPLCF